MAMRPRNGRAGARSLALCGVVGAWLGLGCSSEEAVDPVVRGPVYRGTLDVEIAERADIVMEGDGEDGFAFALTPQGKAGEGFVVAGVTVEGMGKVEAFPEAGLGLFVAQWAGEASG